ncbi:hypothetical protein J6590_098338 [Homalodisca vitripennis]|nr:hypothetical protein J6590_098338 [Homalodisca vitripennis]
MEYSWTPLLVATMGNHVEVVNLLLESKPNVNALDKDGCTALTIACKEGFHDIAVALLNVGAYINIQDRSGDTNLIHAVKGGHRSVVEALLKKYADVDIPGKERKTAMYTSVEKGNIAVMKLLMSANPDLEIATKDGDTCLLRAVRSRNVEAVQLLLEKKARVSASDKRGDTALHIAMRARSKGIVEVLLRNPKNSQLLYRPNRAGETPYNIDMNHQKTILGQIFGARRLNTNEDNEKLLGYDLYSSALADMVSEPSLSMPITVGLYAKWGSGKSFLLNKLREEMKNFARQWVDPTFQFSWLLMAIIVHLAALSGTVVSLSLTHWLPGIVVIFTLLILTYTFLAVVWYGSNRYSWDWPYNLNVYLTRKMNAIKVVLQVIFCHPPGAQWSDSFTAQPIRFYFTDQTRVSSSAAGWFYYDQTRVSSLQQVLLHRSDQSEQLCIMLVLLHRSDQSEQLCSVLVLLHRSDQSEQLCSVLVLLHRSDQSEQLCSMLVLLHRSDQSEQLCSRFYFTDQTRVSSSVASVGNVLMFYFTDQTRVSSSAVCCNMFYFTDQTRVSSSAGVGNMVLLHRSDRVAAAALVLLHRSDQSEQLCSRFYFTDQTRVSSSAAGSTSRSDQSEQLCSRLVLLHRSDQSEQLCSRFYFTDQTRVSSSAAGSTSRSDQSEQLCSRLVLLHRSDQSEQFCSRLVLLHRSDQSEQLCSRLVLLHRSDQSEQLCSRLVLLHRSDQSERLCSRLVLLHRSDQSEQLYSRFYFTDQTRVSSSAAGENSVVQMIGSLYDSIENDYGALSTRLYRALRPKALKSTSSWRWRKLCCLPNIIFFELCYAAALVGGVVLTIYIAEYGRPSYEHKLEEMTCQIVLGMCLLVVVLLVVANLYTISRVIKSLLFSQRRQLQRAIAKLDTLKSEGFLQALRSEVNLMTDMGFHSSVL